MVPMSTKNSVCSLSAKCVCEGLERSKDSGTEACGSPEDCFVNSVGPHFFEHCESTSVPSKPPLVPLGVREDRDGPALGFERSPAWTLFQRLAGGRRPIAMP